MLFKILTEKANHGIRLFSFIFSLIICQHSFATDYQEDHYLNKALHQYFDLQLDSCKLSLGRIEDNPYGIYLEILVESTKIFISDDVNYYRAQKQKEAQFLSKIDAFDGQDSVKNFLKAELKMQWAFIKLKNGDEFSAFWSLRQAYNIAKENSTRYPQFLPSYKTLGLLHILYGIFPDKYDWILSLFGIEGDADRGIIEIEKVYLSSHFLSLESGITIALAKSYLLNDVSGGMEYMSRIHEKNKFLLTDYAFVLILMKNAQSELAEEIISASEKKYPTPFILPHLYYLKAEIFLQKGKIDDAIDNYRLFIAHQKGLNLIKDAHYKIGICYLVKDQPELVEEYFNKAREKGWAKNEADKYAEYALKSESRSKKELYELRYATDGGYYEKALNIRESIEENVLNPHDLCEYLYRTARLYHKMNNESEALEYYRKTIEVQKNESWYFAPNSALQAGLIFKSRGDEKLAEMNLKLIGNYSGYPYQNSIKQKAKAAIKDLN